MIKVYFGLRERDYSKLINLIIIYIEPFFTTLEKNNMFHEHTPEGTIELPYNGRRVVIMLEHPGINFDLVNNARKELQEEQKEVLKKLKDK